MWHNYLVILIWGWLVNGHPFYISLTDIRYNGEMERLEMAQKIFWDDLEVVLSKASGETVDFLNPQDPVLLEKTVKAYLLRHNEITINGKKVEIKYLGYEVEEDAAWFYLEARDIPRPEKVLVKNSVLIDEFGDQQNMVHFYLGKKPKTLILYRDHESDLLEF